MLGYTWLQRKGIEIFAIYVVVIKSFILEQQLQEMSYKSPNGVQGMKNRGQGVCIVISRSQLANQRELLILSQTLYVCF